MRNILVYTLIMLFVLTGCRKSTDISQVEPKSPHVEVVKSNGEKSDFIESVHTTEPVVSLTFNGMAERTIMEEILKVLKTHEMKATFFVEGMRVAQDPELAKKILKHGHALENGTLTFEDMSELDYRQTYEEIFLANETFEKHLKNKPRYVRSRTGDVTDNMMFAAKVLGMKAIVGSSINPQDRKMQSADEIAAYIERFLKRGSIIHLNTYLNPEIINAIPLIADIAERKGYTFVTVDRLENNQYPTKELEEIEELLRQ